jgi:hypothetical protein
MKKLMTIGLAAAMMFAMAVKASATALETSGEYRARLWNLGNYFVRGKSVEFWDQRLRLSLVWPVAEGVKVNVRADIMEGYWGDSLLSKDATGAYVATANPRKPIDFDHVNLQFVWPGSPVTITVGRQDASWGTGLFVKADNRDRFKITAKFGETVLLYTYDKYIEIEALHDTASLDDRTQHSVGAMSKLGGWNVGLIAAAILNETDPNVDSLIAGPDVFAMGKLGPVDVKFEACYLTGKEDKTVGLDVDNQGLMAYVGVSMPAGPVTLGFEGAYAAGDDLTTTDKNEGVAKQDYQGSFWSVILFHNMENESYDHKGSSYSKDTNFYNAIAGKFSVSAAPAPGLSLYGAVVMATRDQKEAGNNEKGLGTEVDLVATYAITPNVSWTVGGGYLMAGDFYGDVDDPWGVKSQFLVKF